ncbi:MAG: hypothetical protein ACR2OB_07420 [Solirubrobacteraceae bacterium]
MVVPIVVVLLQRVLQAARDINRVVDTLAVSGPKVVSDLGAVPQLLTTQNLVHETTAGLARYGAALDEIL